MQRHTDRALPQRESRLFTQKARKRRFSKGCASGSTPAIERVATVQKVIFNVVGLYHLDLSSVFGKYSPLAVSSPPLNVIPPPPSDTSHRVVWWIRAIGSFLSTVYLTASDPMAQIHIAREFDDNI